MTQDNVLYLLRLAGVAGSVVLVVKLRPWRWVAVWWRSRG